MYNPFRTNIKQVKKVDDMWIPKKQIVEYIVNSTIQIQIVIKKEPTPMLVLSLDVEDEKSNLLKPWYGFRNWVINGTSEYYELPLIGGQGMCIKRSTMFGYRIAKTYTPVVDGVRGDVLYDRPKDFKTIGDEKEEHF